MRALRRDDVIPPDAEVVSVWHKRIEHGYPTPFLGRDEALDSILPELERCRVYSRGRFGGWQYEVSNQDHSFAQGVEVVDRWLSGAPELTLHHPEVVNARRPARVEEDRHATVEVRVDEVALEAAVRRLGWRVYGSNQAAEQLSLAQAVLAYRSEYLVERSLGRLKGGRCR